VKAVVLHEPHVAVAVEDVELAAPQDDEIVVRVAAAGVCRSDLHFAEGILGERRWPMVLGHEGAGVVESVGAGVSRAAPGDRVAFSFVPACGRCGPCLSGRPNLCEAAGRAALRGTLLDGTSRLRLDGDELQHCLLTSCFAERAVLAEAGAIPLPDGIPLWQAALLGCGVMTGVGAVRNTARVQPGDAVCVVGCGGVGLHVIAGARLAGAAAIVAVDRDLAKLELARKRGATHSLDAAEGPRAVRKLTDGGVDYAFEVVGIPETIRFAWDTLRPGGNAVVVGLAGRGVEVSLPAIEFLSEKSILGCYYGSANVAVELLELVRFVADGELELGEVVSHFTDLAGVQDALDRLRRGEGARTIVVVDSELADAPPEAEH
jgi:S-(hydroxymethyl)glutathione dehydrogenase / alcohol dehydrogenase